jgi:hypothetical protein
VYREIDTCFFIGQMSLEYLEVGIQTLVVEKAKKSLDFPFVSFTNVFRHPMISFPEI